MDFETTSIDALEACDPQALDGQEYGVIGFGEDRIVDLYSAAESRMAGLSPERVVGRHLFTTVAPCMNNALVARRFDEEPVLDETIDYVLTLKLRPTKVRLRMLQGPTHARRYVLIKR